MISTIWQEENQEKKSSATHMKGIFCGKKKNQEKKSSATSLSLM
jgi:hypothetical protein